MTIKELTELCKGRENYKIVIRQDNSEGWYNICDEIDINDELKEIYIYPGELA